MNNDQSKLRMTMKFKITSFFALLIFIMPISIYPAPYNGEIFDLAQPDGTLVSVKIFGDEFYQDVEGLDGYTLIRDPANNWICYAALSGDGMSYVSTGIVYDPVKSYNAVRSSASRMHLRIKTEAMRKLADQKRKLLKVEPLSGSDTDASLTDLQASADIEPAPMAGTIYGLTLLINFPDLSSSISRTEIDNMLNQQGYSGYSNNGSVRDYFYDASSGNLIYLNKVPEFVMVSKPKTYYDDNSEYGKVAELMVEALTLLKNSGFNFGSLSTTGDRFYAVNVMYAGTPSQGWAKGLWPHSGNLNGAFKVNNIAVRNYQMTNIGTSLSIGTFVHENGHMLLNFRDLYAYDGHDNGVGSYCVMCYNASKNPQMFNPYFRYLKGWLTVTNISNVSNIAFTHTANTNSAFYYSAGANEMFFIEARRKTGRSASLPDEGLAIWHIDTNGNNMYTGYNHLVSIEQADGKFDLEKKVNNGDKTDLFKSGLNTKFNDTTAPNAHWNTGVNSGLKIHSISGVGDTMSFIVGDGTPAPTPTPTPAGLKGDANGDGKIDMIDALLIGQYTVGIEVTINISLADVNKDGKVDMVDALLIAQYTVGIISSL